MPPRLPATAPAGPVLVHSDAFETRLLVPRSSDRRRLLAAHLETLARLADGRELWHPAFNYDYLRSGRFATERDASQVGPISEAFRVAASDWRTLVPVFSVSGAGPRPPLADALPELVDPFDDGSIFARLVALDGSVLWYGAPLSSTTLVHHVERAVPGGPLYRYDKDFPGTVTAAREEPRRVVLRYHVRPLDRPTDYDWERLGEEARRAGLLADVAGTEGTCRWAPARALVQLWTGILAADPLGLLDAASRAWLEPLLTRLGRRFRLGDFEREPGSEP